MPADPMSERVLVVPAADLDRLGRFQGFSPDVEHYVHGLLRPELIRFLPRRDVEDDPSLKQIIPYVVFTFGSSVFCYTRGSSQGESRLHRKRSLGVGGHVAEEDADGRGTFEAYEQALLRELDEEVAIEASGRHRPVGLINDDSTPVGSVHLGVVHLFELEAPNLSAREDGLKEAQFVPVDNLCAWYEDFETWSRICLDNWQLLTGRDR